MRSPHATFIVATFQRVDALRCTLKSLILQDHRDWTALVIGDCCGDETAVTIRALQDSRIRYYNLPARCGEQSGPNTFGLRLAEGEFISFLNHDDLLLRDHAQHGLAEMAVEDADFFIGRFANVTELGDDSAAGIPIPIATKVLPASDDLSLLIEPDAYIFDPSSFWLVRSAYARSVGPWKPARALWRTPLRDWLMRAWRRGGRFCFGAHVTGIRFWTQNLRRNGPLYSNQTPEHEFMLRLIETESSDALRSRILRQVQSRGPCSTFESAHMARFKRQWLAALYRRLGVDHLALTSRLRGIPRGALMKSITRKRTGTTLPARWSIDEFLRDPHRYRVL